MERSDAPVKERQLYYREEAAEMIAIAERCDQSLNRATKEHRAFRAHERVRQPEY